MAVYGADVAALRNAAAHFDQAAERLSSVRTLLSAQIARTHWTGPNASHFRSSWDGDHSRELVSAAARLREAAVALRRNAAAQEETSAASGGALAAVGTVGAATGAAAGDGPIGGSADHPPSGSTPAEVEDWWQSLDADQQKALVEDDSLYIGNLDGVPMDVRAEANRNTAQDRLAEPGIAQNERDYLQQVVDGDRQLVVYDPAGQRIVEMIGTPSKTTTHVITYVPGTDTNMDSYYNGGVQQVANYLQSRDKSGNTVAFVYKDGPWAEWGLGENANVWNKFAQDRGNELALFQQGAFADPRLANAERVGVAHSAGLSILTSSEVAGATYDKELSLGGSWIQDGWSANSSTDYSHYQYGIDAINALDPISSTPHESSDFEQHNFTPNSVNIFGVELQDPGANHGRIAEGAPSNQNALIEMYKDIHRG